MSANKSIVLHKLSQISQLVKSNHEQFENDLEISSLLDYLHTRVQSKAVSQINRKKQTEQVNTLTNNQVSNSSPQITQSQPKQLINFNKSSRKVYIPVPLDCGSRKSDHWQLNNYSIGIRGKLIQNAKDINVNIIQEFIGSNTRCIQVGKSEAEAISIINQHSIRNMHIIVGCRINESSIMGTLPETHLQPGVINAGTTSFLTLNKTPEIEEIVYIAPVNPEEYRTTMRAGVSDFLDKYWPEDAVYQKSQHKTYLVSNSLFRQANECPTEDDYDSDYDSDSDFDCY